MIFPDWVILEVKIKGRKWWSVLRHFSCGTRIIAGAGARWELKHLGARRVFMVTDRYFSEKGTAQDLVRGLDCQYQIFDEVQPDPSAELAARGTKALQEFSPDLVVALGGGSPMDCAKAMVYFSGLKVPLAAIPTTSGSGAEVTDFAIVTCNGIKKPLVDPALAPQFAILDSELLNELPRSLIADSGFDVLAHALEAAVGRNAGPITDALAAKAFRTAYALLPLSFGGNTGVRMEVHEASTMAAMAFSQAGLGICHALSHTLGGMYHIPHGRLNAILLPAVVSANAHCAQGKYAVLAREAGFSGAAEALAVRNLKNGLVRLRRELRLPATLAEAGVKPADVRRNTATIVTNALRDPCCQTNPAEATAQLLEEVLEEVVGRG